MGIEHVLCIYSTDVKEDLTWYFSWLYLYLIALTAKRLFSLIIFTAKIKCVILQLYLFIMIYQNNLGCLNLKQKYSGFPESPQNMLEKYNIVLFNLCTILN